MKFGHTELFCTSVKETSKFYIDVLGFELVAEQSPDTIWVGLGDREILLRTGRSIKDYETYQDSNTALVLYTDNLEETKTKLEKNGLKFKGIDGSTKCLTFQDPEGHWWQLVNPKDH